MISFFVPGVPISQGSKRHVGGGRMIESSKRLKPWRAQVAATAFVAMDQQPLYDEPLWMSARFCFWRPQSHYRTGRFSELLKPSAPEAPMTYPDIEKLVRATNDAMEGIVFRNDSLVAQLHAEKVYAEQLGVYIAIAPLREPIPTRLLDASNGDLHHAASVLRMTPHPRQEERGSREA